MAKNQLEKLMFDLGEKVGSSNIMMEQAYHHVQILKANNPHSDDIVFISRKAFYEENIKPICSNHFILNEIEKKIGELEKNLNKL